MKNFLQIAIEISAIILKTEIRNSWSLLGKAIEIVHANFSLEIRFFFSLYKEKEKLKRPLKK